MRLLVCEQASGVCLFDSLSSTATVKTELSPEEEENLTLSSEDEAPSANKICKLIVTFHKVSRELGENGGL